LKGTGQEEFPGAEIHSIAHYLIHESQDYLLRKDKYRRDTDGRERELKELERNNQISDQQRKELVLIERRLETIRKHEPTPLKDAAGKVHLIGAEGNPLDAKAVAALFEKPEGDKATQQIELGRHLFTVKGCLACHQHQDAPVPGTQTFGPDLSRVAAKIRPEGAEQDRDARLRWLVQWVMNP